MGELILCKAELAAMPYYIESASLNIYSLEELCYYIVTYPDRLDETFWTEELCDWIDRELQCEDLAQRLYTKIENKENTLNIVRVIVESCGFFRGEEKKTLYRRLLELENKSEYEKEKIIADRFLLNHQYAKSIMKYRLVLELDGKEPMQAVEKGCIWHNMGVAHANMFLYKEAADCFKKAYSYSNNPESKLEMYLALQCVMNKDDRKEDESLVECKEDALNQIKKAVDGFNDADDVEISIDKIKEWKERYQFYSKV